MTARTIDAASEKFSEMGFVVEKEPAIPGVHGLLYACSPQFFSLGFAKVKDHFLFVDWEYAAFRRLDSLLEDYKKFSRFVNQEYRVPHSLRMRIPNLAVVALSWSDFSTEAIQFVENNYLTPWYGGEAGQLILVNPEREEMISHATPRIRQQGSLPLRHAVEVIYSALFDADIA